MKLEVIKNIRPAKLFITIDSNSSLNPSKDTLQLFNTDANKYYIIYRNQENNKDRFFIELLEFENEETQKFSIQGKLLGLRNLNFCKQIGISYHYTNKKKIQVFETALKGNYGGNLFELKLCDIDK